MVDLPLVLDEPRRVPRLVRCGRVLEFESLLLLERVVLVREETLAGTMIEDGAGVDVWRVWPGVEAVWHGGEGSGSGDTTADGAVDVYIPSHE